MKNRIEDWSVTDSVKHIGRNISQSSSRGCVLPSDGSCLWICAHCVQSCKFITTALLWGVNKVSHFSHLFPVGHSALSRFIYFLSHYSLQHDLPLTPCAHAAIFSFFFFLNCCFHSSNTYNHPLVPRQVCCFPPWSRIHPLRSERYPLSPDDSGYSYKAELSPIQFSPAFLFTFPS